MLVTSHQESPLIHVISRPRDEHDKSPILQYRINGFCGNYFGSFARPHGKKPKGEH